MSRNLLNKVRIPHICTYKPFPYPAPTNGCSGSYAATCKSKRGSSVRGWIIIHPHYDGGFRRSCYVSQELWEATGGRTIYSSGLSIDTTIQWPSHIREDQFRGSITSLQRDIMVHTQSECAGCPTLQYCWGLSPSTVCHVYPGSVVKFPFPNERFAPSHWGCWFFRHKIIILRP